MMKAFFCIFAFVAAGAPGGRVELDAGAAEEFDYMYYANDPWTRAILGVDGPTIRLHVDQLMFPVYFVTMALAAIGIEFARRF